MLLRHYLTPRALAYWILCDGSLHRNGKTLVLHTQAFSKKQNLSWSRELNRKWGFHTRVLPHKDVYFVIEFPARDSAGLRELLKDRVDAVQDPSSIENE